MININKNSNAKINFKLLKENDNLQKQDEMDNKKILYDIYMIVYFLIICVSMELVFILECIL